MASAGDAFLLGDGGHLWIIITATDADDAGSFVMVNVTSLGEHIEDTSCTLEVGDHPFIKHPSVVSYKDARAWHCNGRGGYEHFLKTKQIHPQSPVSSDVLRRIQEGALKSAFTKGKFRAAIQSTLR